MAIASSHYENGLFNFTVQLRVTNLFMYEVRNYTKVALCFHCQHTFLTMQSSWLQIHRSGFDSRRYQIFREVLGLEQGPLSLASTTEERLERKSSESSPEILEYGSRGSIALTTWYPLSAKVGTTPTRGGHSVSIVHSRTQATEFFLYVTYTYKK
jgi:hypothetical protein